MTRNELKALIKECLVEIITEGSGPVRESKSRQPAPPSPPPRRHPSLDSIVVGNRPAPQPKRAPPIPPQNFNAITNDPIMASIFADTASTTLVEQVGAESGRGNPRVETGVDPGLFEGSANWATLAFADSPRKNHQ